MRSTSYDTCRWRFVACSYCNSRFNDRLASCLIVNAKSYNLGEIDLRTCCLRMRFGSNRSSHYSNSFVIFDPMKMVINS
jgi:hypothetical protein